MYLNHIHNFRSFAICGIIAAHALHNFDWSSSQLTFDFFDSLFNESSIWFFFIAGFLFQYLSPKYNYKDYIIKKIKFVILPYILISIPALIASELWVRQEVPDAFYLFPVWKQTLIFLLTGKHLAPFWFVPTISLFYLLAPLFIKLDKLKWPYLFLPLFMLLSAYLGRDGLLQLTGISGYFSPISKAVYLFSVYCFGILCSRYHNRILNVMSGYHVVLSILAAIMLFSQVYWHGEQVYFQFLFKIITCLLWVYYLYRIDSRIGNKISYLGTISFGIFFIHGYLLSGFKIFYFNVLDISYLPEGNILIYFLLVFTTAALCSLILFLARLGLGRKSRMVVGC